MEFFGLTSLFCIALVVVTCFIPIRKAFYILVVSSVLTTMAIVDIGDASVLAYQPIWLVLAVRVTFRRFRTGKRMRLPWLPFLALCFASTFLAPFSGDVIVLNVDSKYAPVSYSCQQYTQFIYLVMAVSTAWFTAYLLQLREISFNGLIKTMNIGLILVLAVAFLQLILPADVVTETVRNSAHASYTSSGSRISSTFQEPSMLSQYIIPMIAMNVIFFILRPNIPIIITIALSLSICVLNISSSAIVGIAVAAVVITFQEIFPRRLHSRRNFKIDHAVIVCLLVAAFAFLLLLLSGRIGEMIDTLFGKLAGEGQSGAERTLAARVMLGVFIDHPLFGVGWGTSRSLDLLSTWLAEIGIVGIILFSAPYVQGVALRGRLIHDADSLYRRCLSSYLIVSFVIMLVSVPEPYYLSYWIVSGALYCLGCDKAFDHSRYGLIYATATHCTDVKRVAFPWLCKVRDDIDVS